MAYKYCIKKESQRKLWKLKAFTNDRKKIVKTYVYFSTNEHEKSAKHNFLN